jgi:hypothetical protein
MHLMTPFEHAPVGCLLRSGIVTVPAVSIGLKDCIAKRIARDDRAPA